MRAGGKFRIQNSEFRSQEFRKKDVGIPYPFPLRPPSQSFPLCGLRDLCAMLSFPWANRSRTENSGVFRPGFPLVPFVPIITPLWPP